MVEQIQNAPPADAADTKTLAERIATAIYQTVLRRALRTICGTTPCA